MQLKFKKTKPDLFKFLFSFFRFFNYILSLIILLVAFGLGIFIYRYFYQTITQAQEVIVLKQEVAPNTIDTQHVDRVVNSLEKKKSAPSTDWSSVNNPFGTTVIEPTIEPAVAVPVAATDVTTQPQQ